MRPTSLHRRLAAVAALLPVAAAAHPGHEASGFVPDLAHLFLSADHLLAMLAVGLWALSLGLAFLPAHRFARLAGVPIALAGSWLLVKAIA